MELILNLTSEPTGKREIMTQRLAKRNRLDTPAAISRTGLRRKPNALRLYPHMRTMHPVDHHLDRRSNHTLTRTISLH